MTCSEHLECLKYAHNHGCPWCFAEIEILSYFLMKIECFHKNRFLFKHITCKKRIIEPSQTPTLTAQELLLESMTVFSHLNLYPGL